MNALDRTFIDRIGMDNPEKGSKLRRHPVGETMSSQEKAKIIAALAAANEKTKLFPKK